MDNSQFEAFIQDLKDNKNGACAIYLVNGIKLTGHCEAHDDVCVVLGATTGRQVVMRSAISTIIPSKEEGGGRQQQRP